MHRERQFFEGASEKRGNVLERKAGGRRREMLEKNIRDVVSGSPMRQGALMYVAASMLCPCMHIRKKTF